MNKFLTIAALLLLTSFGARAEQTVTTVIKPSAAAGTVTSAISNGVCTLTVTPASGYYLTVENLSAVTTLNGGAMQTPRRRIDIDPGTPVEITAADASADPSKTTTYTFPMPENQDFDVEVTAEFQTLIAINPEVTLDGWTYGEQPKTPVVEGNLGKGAVTFTYQAEGATEFTETVPTNAGTHTVKASVAAANKYTAGEATNTFVISAKAVTAAMITDIADQTYSGTPITPTLTVKDGETTLTLNTDYDVAYENNTNAGSATATITGKGNYTGTASKTFTIGPKTVTAAMIADIADQTYTGTAITPTLTVKDGETTLTLNTDYDVAYENNTNAGPATATITGKGNYSGTASKTFTIIAKSLSTGYTVSVDATQTYTYTGSEIKPTAGTVTPAAGGTALVQGKDYTITGYANNINAATADAAAAPTVTVTGMGNYTGSASGTFTIGKAELTDLKVALDGWTYGEEPKTPVVTGNLGNGAVTFTYQAEGATEFTETVPTNAGSHVVKAVVAESDNYLGAEATSNFTIAKASVTLSFSAESISTPVNETPEWPVLNNPKGVKVVYSSSAPEVAEVNEATGEVTMKTPGTTIIKATTNDSNYESAEATYVLEVTSYAYKLKIDGKVVTEENRKSLFEDGSVIFNGVNRLYLTDAKIVGIESGLDSLEIYIKGTNVIEAEKDKYAIRDLTPARTQNLRFLTDNTDPGSLQLLSENSIVFGFDTITVEKPLIAETSPSGLELNSGETNNAMIVVPLDPVVDGENKNKTIDYGGDSGGAGNEDLTNIIIDNVLYTLHDTQTAGVSDDGFYDGMVVLNSTVSDGDVENALQLIPSTDEYAKAFKGITIMVPAGTGKITVKLFTQEGHGFCVNLGGLIKQVIETHGKILVYTIPYSCSIATYVYIYHVEIDGAAAANNNHRIGPKATVSTGIGSLQVSADQIDTPPAAQADYLSLSRDDIMIPEGGAGHIIVENEKVTDLNGDAFGSMFDNEDMAPKRRAYGNYDITYIDLRGTSITGKEFSRDEEPFKGLPETTFIYLPAGNIVSGKNMVVGSVCDSLLLGNDYYSFECAPGGFTATTAILERPFEADKKKPFYVPFALSNHEDYGTFFEFDELKNGVVEMKKATTVAANTAYYLQANEGGVENIEAQSVQVEPLEEEPYSGLIGTYMPIALFSDSYVYDNDLKQFRKGNLDYAAPFEVYLSINSNESTLLTHWEGEPAPTAVEAVRTESAETNQWYSLDGRKLQEQPTRKGVYLKNSKKLVVK